MFNLFTNVDTKSLDGIPQLINNLIGFASFVAGAISVIFIIIGGIRYITSAGNPNGLAQAKKTIVFAIGGLLVSLFAWLIVRFILGTFFLNV